MKPLNRIITVCAISIIVLLVAGVLALKGCRKQDGLGLEAGAVYEVVQPLYVMAVYDSANRKVLSRETATAYLHAQQYADRYFVAFQSEVPAGTTLTVLGAAPKAWILPFLADRYFIKLEPDVSGGLDVVLSLDRGLEGDSDGLNTELFRRKPPQPDKIANKSDES